MADVGARAARDSISENLYEVDSADPRSELIDRSALSTVDVAQIGALMKALARLRQAEQAVAEASQRYMKLSALDMRALHYLIVAKHRREVVSPGMLAAHLGISAASTTKLLNRLEKGAHIVRRVHPLDRRAFAIEVTAETEVSAMQTVGRQHATRFTAAARLSVDERAVVMRFLEDMTNELSMTGVEWAKEPEAHDA